MQFYLGVIKKLATGCHSNATDSLIFLFTFMHLADTFIQSDLQCIQFIHFLSVCVEH